MNMNVKVAQLCLTLCDPMDCSLPGSSVHEDSPGKNTRVGCCAPPPGDLPNLGVEPRSPTLKAESLPFEPPEKPKNTGRGSLSLLQGNLPKPGMQLGLPALQEDSSPAELPGISYYL